MVYHSHSHQENCIIVYKPFAFGVRFVFAFIEKQSKCVVLPVNLMLFLWTVTSRLKSTKSQFDRALNVDVWRGEWQWESCRLVNVCWSTISMSRACSNFKRPSSVGQCRPALWQFNTPQHTKKEMYRLKNETHYSCPVLIYSRLFWFMAVWHWLSWARTYTI